MKYQYQKYEQARKTHSQELMLGVDNLRSNRKPPYSTVLVITDTKQPEWTHAGRCNQPRNQWIDHFRVYAKKIAKHFLHHIFVCYILETR